jgi:hypothetical protein
METPPNHGIRLLVQPVFSYIGWRLETLRVLSLLRLEDFLLKASHFSIKAKIKAPSGFPVEAYWQSTGVFG